MEGARQTSEVKAVDRLAAAASGRRNRFQTNKAPISAAVHQNTLDRGSDGGSRRGDRVPRHKFWVFFFFKKTAPRAKSTPCGSPPPFPVRQIGPWDINKGEAGPCRAHTVRDPRGKRRGQALLAPPQTGPGPRQTPFNAMWWRPSPKAIADAPDDKEIGGPSC